MTKRRDPRQEASALLPPGHEARVLAPSPPADLDPDWFADDPTDPSGATETVVTPVPGEGTIWADLAEADEGIGRYAAEHWLDGRRRLEPLPDGVETARRALHQIAFFAIAPTRHAANGKLGLRYTHRGFGTPFFRGSDGDEQVRVAGDELVHQVGDSARSEPLTTVRRAVRFLGLDYRETWFEGFHDPLDPVDPDATLNVDPVVAESLAGWFGFATHVLERARRTPGAIDVSRVQLWPEHFDAAVEMGSAAGGSRAAYGASPGDDDHAEPYLYIAAWDPVDRADPFWNTTRFNGASLGYAELLTSDDPYAAALAFMRDGHRKLTAR